MKDFRRRGERVDQHCSASFTRRERCEKRRGRWQQDRGALPTERPYQWCAALQQRKTGSDKLLDFEVIDTSAARGEGEREQGKRVEHVRFGRLGFGHLKGE